MTNFIFCIIIICLFLFWIGFLSVYSLIKEKNYKKAIIAYKEDPIVGSEELLDEICHHFMLRYNFAAIFNFKSLQSNLCVTISKKEFLSQKNIPTSKEIFDIIEKKNLEFFAYKITKENNIFNLTLTREKACFKLDTLKINDKIQICDGDYYCFKCGFILINDCTFEEIFKENMSGNNRYKNDTIYLPIKVKKIFYV